MNNLNIMSSYMNKLRPTILSFCVLACTACFANDVYITRHLSLLQKLKGFYPEKTSHDYTVLDAEEYKGIFSSSRHKIEKIIKKLQPFKHENLNTKVALIIKELIDIPYIQSDGMGEGDWISTSLTYQRSNLHVQQNPVYRLDGLNCQTFVQIVMALLHADNLAQFDESILKISYGAAGNPNGEIVRYYNRNNFIDGDFNPINQRNGWLQDVTLQKNFAPYSKTTHATITRQKWFIRQQQNLTESVKVLHTENGPAMVNRFRTTYSALNFPRFNSESITMSYLPKENLALSQSHEGYKPNQILLDQIPTPAIVEIVRDVNKWNLYGVKIKNMIGTELTISHLGILHRQTFKNGELIYRKITCAYVNSQKICRVAPITCQKKQCQELLLTHATDAYPINYLWYKKSDGEYACTSKQPPIGIHYTNCNRVTTLPLYDYLTTYQMGSYWAMELPSILGIHIEKLKE